MILEVGSTQSNERDLRKYILMFGFVFKKGDGGEVQISGKFNKTKGCFREGNGGEQNKTKQNREIKQEID